MKSNALAIVTLLLLASTSATAQNMKALWNDGAFAVARQSIEGLEPPARRDQLMAMWMTMVGREDLQTTIGRPIAGEPLGDCLDKEQAEAATWASAEDWLLEQLAERRVVMFNENHYRTGARAWLLEWLPRLREQGFTHLGLEAFTPQEDGLYRPEDGFYTREPLFAALVRGAEALGFEVFGYEVTDSPPEGADMHEQIAFREQAQADNLLAVFSEAEEVDRFVIFAGWSHIAKKPMPGGHRWMAARFKEQSGIDPFSVDLTTCTRLASRHDGPGDAWLPLSEDGQAVVVGHYAGAVDAQLHMPVPADISGSAGFYRQVLGPARVVSDKWLAEDEAVLVRARRSDRAANAVPDDQVMIQPGERLKLYLPAGYEYLITAHRGDGSYAFSPPETH